MRSCNLFGIVATLILAVPALTVSAATPFFTDDFQSGLPGSWEGPNVTIESGGQDGAADQFLLVTATGGGGPGSHLATHNSTSNWTGDYLAAEIQSISVDLMNPTTSANPLNMRLVLFGPNSFSERWTSSVAADVPNDGVWRRYEFSVAEASLSQVLGGTSYNDLMAGVLRTMLRHDVTGSAGGTAVVASLGIDNITLDGILAGDFDSNGLVDSLDINLLYDEIFAGTNDAAFDLDGDGSVDNVDIGEWLTVAGTANSKTYLTGDANLDGSVGGSDFTTLASKFGTSEIDPADGAYWGDANFNGVDPTGFFTVGGADFTQLASNFGHVSASAVPEPASLSLLALALLACLRLRRP